MALQLPSVCSASVYAYISKRLSRSSALILCLHCVGLGEGGITDFSLANWTSPNTSCCIISISMGTSDFSVDDLGNFLGGADPSIFSLSSVRPNLVLDSFSIFLA